MLNLQRVGSTSGSTRGKSRLKTFQSFWPPFPTVFASAGLSLAGLALSDGVLALDANRHLRWAEVGLLANLAKSCAPPERQFTEGSTVAPPGFPEG